MSDLQPGLQVYIDGVHAAEDEAARIDLEADIESVIADVLRNHPLVQDGATVSADYVGVDQ